MSTARPWVFKTVIFTGLLLLLFGVSTVVSRAFRLENTDSSDNEDVRYVEVFTSVDSPAADTLRHAWERYRLDVNSSEYAFCITSYRVRMLPDSTPWIEIDSLVLAPSDSATPESIQYHCGAFPSLHSHPPTDCRQLTGKRWSCVPSSDTNRLCEPSRQDLATVDDEWHRFHGVQCGTSRFFFYSPIYRKTPPE